MKLSLGRKLGIGFAIVSLLTVSSAVITYFKISTMDAVSTKITTLRIPVLVTAKDYEDASDQGMNKVREYILMADDAEYATRSRAAFDNQEKKMDADLQKLKEFSPRFSIRKAEIRLTN